MRVNTFRNDWLIYQQLYLFANMQSRWNSERRFFFCDCRFFVAGRAYYVVRVDGGDVILLFVFDYVERSKPRQRRENFRFYCCWQAMKISGNFIAKKNAMIRPLPQWAYAISIYCRDLCIYGRCRGEKKNVVLGNKALAPMLSQAELLS